MKDFSYFKNTIATAEGSSPTLDIWIDGEYTESQLIFCRGSWSYCPQLDCRGLSEAEELRTVADKLDKLNAALKA